MMNRETTALAPASRAVLARSATEALEALAESIRRELDRHAAAYGLSDAKLEVLEVLACREEHACLCELGDHLNVTRPNVTKLVDGLERAGLVERRPHPGDGRRVQAHLTPSGEALAATGLPGRTREIERRWEGLDDEALRSLIGLLERAAG
jgi:DNA-binding MarR family transcriptional regulator